jgi:hypothetical protein
MVLPDLRVIKSVQVNRVIAATGWSRRVKFLAGSVWRETLRSGKSATKPETQSIAIWLKVTAAHHGRFGNVKSKRAQRRMCALRRVAGSSLLSIGRRSGNDEI